MQFCRNAQSLGNSGLQLSGPSGSVWTREAEDALRRQWMPKCLLVGIVLGGISYCLVYITGIYERSLTLTVFTLLTFLFIYILWCKHQKQRHHNQNVSARNRTGSSVTTISELVSPSLPPFPPAPLNVPDKCDTLPSSRACTPPPSYQEAMLGTVAVNPVLPTPQILSYQEAVLGTATVNPVPPPPHILSYQEAMLGTAAVNPVLPPPQILSYQEAMLGTAAVNPVLPPPQILSYQEAMLGTAAVNPVPPQPQTRVHSHLPSPHFAMGTV